MEQEAKAWILRGHFVHLLLVSGQDILEAQGLVCQSRVVGLVPTALLPWV